jgi:hypothetical protein
MAIIIGLNYATEKLRYQFEIIVKNHANNSVDRPS